MGQARWGAEAAEATAMGLWFAGLLLSCRPPDAAAILAWLSAAVSAAGAVYISSAKIVSHVRACGLRCYGRPAWAETLACGSPAWAETLA
jgi:hypothetical protein